MLDNQLYKISFNASKGLCLKRVVVTFIVFAGSLPSFGSPLKAIDLYGHTVKINYSAPVIGLKTPLKSADLNTNISILKNSNLTNLVSQLDSISNHFGMDDIAFLLFTDKVSKNVYPDVLRQGLFRYALLQTKGYRVLLGYSYDYLTVYGHLDFKVHNVAFVNYEKFVLTDISFLQNLEPCEELLLESSNGGRAITMNENRPPLFDAITKQFNIHFEYEGMQYNFKGILNHSMVSYYRELPTIAFGQVYLNYKFSKQVESSLINSLKLATKNMFPSKQIDFLLQFAQNAFRYKTDYESMGREKFAFPEEVLANQFADCEDKSVLFAYLAKEVLDLPSVALIYYIDNHLNVGVAFNHKSAYNFIYNNQKYLVCEPSGLGFKPGDNVYDLKKASIVNW
jgi:hypothetical protein